MFSNVVNENLEDNTIYDCENEMCLLSDKFKLISYVLFEIKIGEKSIEVNAYHNELKNIIQEKCLKLLYRKLNEDELTDREIKDKYINRILLNKNYKIGLRSTIKNQNITNYVNYIERI